MLPMLPSRSDPGPRTSASHSCDVGSSLLSREGTAAEDGQIKLASRQDRDERKSNRVRPSGRGRTVDQSDQTLTLGMIMIT